MSSYIYLFLYSVIFLHKFFLNAEFTSEDCRALGYVKSELMCSSCEQLSDFGLDQLKPNCLECYPQIQAFIKSDRPSKFPNLSIKYVRGLDPMVKLMDENGHVKETLSIAKWNTDTVQEFFETVLEKPKKDDNDFLKTNMV